MKTLFCTKCGKFHIVEAHITACPICGAHSKEVIITKDLPQDLGYTHFLNPAEVRAMSKEEVKNNYAWIIASMSRAH